VPGGKRISWLINWKPRVNTTESSTDDKRAKRSARRRRVLERGRAALGRRPTAELNLPGLRTWQLARYPHILVYVDCPGHIDLWRVLHGQRDIPAWMQEPEIG
jgi:plasmid stabilization system protein ParE